MRKIFRPLASLLILIFCISTTAKADKTQTDKIQCAKSALYEVFSVVDCQHCISGNTSGFIIQFSKEGMSSTILMSYLFGDEETDKLWKEYKAATVDLHHELCSYIEQCGIQKPNLTLMLTDHEEKETIYLLIVNGQVVYDFLDK